VTFGFFLQNCGPN